jgi:hypothetical protein
MVPAKEYGGGGAYLIGVISCGVWMQKMFNIALHYKSFLVPQNRYKYIKQEISH